MNAETMPQTGETMTASPETPQAGIKETPLSAQAELAALAMKNSEYDSRLDSLAASKDETASKLAGVRQKLGLPPLEETPPSLQHLDDKMKKIEEEKKALAERRQELLSEEEKEKLISVEKLRLLNQAAATLKREFLSLAPEVQSAVIETGRVPYGMALRLPPGMSAQEPEQFRALIIRVIEGKEITEEDLSALPEAFETVEEKAKDAAEKNVDTAIKHLERGDSPDILTATDREILREADELLIGYEGGSYTPESLLARVEEQNKEAEAANISATADAAATYNPDTQAN